MTVTSWTVDPYPPLRADRRDAPAGAVAAGIGVSNLPRARLIELWTRDTPTANNTMQVASGRIIGPAYIDYVEGWAWPADLDAEFRIVVASDDAVVSGIAAGVANIQGDTLIERFRNPTALGSAIKVSDSLHTHVQPGGTAALNLQRIVIGRVVLQPEFYLKIAYLMSATGGRPSFRFRVVENIPPDLLVDFLIG